MIDYSYIQAGLLLQMLVWFNLYHLKPDYNRLLQTGFGLGAIASTLLIHVYQPRIGFFTPSILTQYVWMVVAATTVFNVSYSFNKAVSLGFLTVFLNSLYWELPYHLLEMYNAGAGLLVLDWWIVRLPQWIRIAPAFFLYRNYDLRNLRYLAVGLVASYVLMYIRLKYHILGVNIHPVARLICLGLLVKTVLESPEKEREEEDDG